MGPIRGRKICLKKYVKKSSNQKGLKSDKPDNIKNSIYSNTGSINTPLYKKAQNKIRIGQWRLLL